MKTAGFLGSPPKAQLHMAIRGAHIQVLFTHSCQSTLDKLVFCCLRGSPSYFFPRTSSADTCWFCMNEVKKSEFRHTLSHLSPFESHK